MDCVSNSIEQNEAFLTGANDRAVNDDVGFQAIPWDVCQQLQRLSHMQTYRSSARLETPQKTVMCLLTAEICWRLQISAMITWHVLKLWLMAWLQGSKLDKDQRMVAMTRFPSCYFENKRDSSGPFPSQNLINNLGKHAIHLRSNLTSHPTLVMKLSLRISRLIRWRRPTIKIHIHSNLSRLEYFKSLCQDLWYNSMIYKMQKHHTRVLLYI